MLGWPPALAERALIAACVGFAILLRAAGWRWTATSCSAPPIRASDTNNNAEGENKNADYIWYEFGSTKQVNPHAPNDPPQTAKNDGYTQPWLCDLKIGDLALVFFTYCLVVVGWFGIRSGEQTVRRLERAYVSGGGGPASDDSDQFVLTIENYGKTVAITREYALVVCPLNQLPPRHEDTNPGYNRIRWINTIRPGGATISVANALIIGPDPIAYGRFWYTDIWGGEHIFSFILPIGQENNHGAIAHADGSYLEMTESHAGKRCPSEGEKDDKHPPQ